MSTRLKGWPRTNVAESKHAASANRFTEAGSPLPSSRSGNMVRGWMVLLLLGGVAAYGLAEEITLTTYYPSPRGVYNELRTAGNVQIGRLDAPAGSPPRLHVVQGDAAPALRVDDEAPVGSLLDATPFLIDATGQVGIGTTMPASKLDIAVPGEGTRALRLISGTNTFLEMTPTNQFGRFQTVLDAVNGRDLVFTTSGNPEGNIGIRTITPQATLDVAAQSEGVRALRLRAGPNAFLDVTPTNVGGHFQTVLDTVNDRDLILLSGAGNVGIGTTTPRNPLEIVGNDFRSPLRVGNVGGDTSLALDRRDSQTPGYIEILDDVAGIGWHAGVLLNGGNPNSSFSIGPNRFLGQSHMTITQNGNVGIGLSNPAEKLDVLGNVRVAGNIVATGSITGNSDARLKEHILPLTDTLAKLEQVRGVSFEWNALAESSMGRKRGEKNIGLIAQELQAVYPELVIPTPYPGGKEFLSVDYMKFTAVLLQAVKELKGEVDSLNELKTEIESLREKITILEHK